MKSSQVDITLNKLMLSNFDLKRNSDNFIKNVELGLFSEISEIDIIRNHFT